MELWRRLDVSTSPESVAQARAFVADTCADWDVHVDPDDLALVVSELVTNAVHFAEGPIAVFVARRLDRLVVAVEDHSAEFAAPPMEDVLATWGRGLLVVDAVAERWGESALSGGKRVWAEFPLTAVSLR